LWKRAEVERAYISLWVVYAFLSIRQTNYYNYTHEEVQCICVQHACIVSLADSTTMTARREESIVRSKMKCTCDVLRDLHIILQSGLLRCIRILNTTHCDITCSDCFRAKFCAFLLVNLFAIGLIIHHTSTDRPQSAELYDDPEERASVTRASRSWDPARRYTIRGPKYLYVYMPSIKQCT